MKLLSLIPVQIRTGIALASVIGLGLFYLQHRAAIYRDGYEDAGVQIERELDLQEAANREAMRLAEQRYAQSVDAITLERDRLNDVLDNLTLEAAADPGADRCGIGADSVQRLNRIR